MKKVLGIILCILLVGGIVGCGNTANKATSDEDESVVEINIGKDPYKCTWIPANIIKQIAEEKGYKVNFVEGDIGFMYLGLAQGDIDIFPDVWLPVLHKTYMDKYSDKIEIVGNFIEQAPMGIAVPSYVPFDSLDDLKENAELVNNKIIGIEPSAGIMLTTEETIEKYELEDSIELMEGSTPAMLAELDKAVKTEEPIVFLAWRPHIMFSKYDIKILEDSKGIWQFDNYRIGVNLDLEDKAPDLHKFLQEFSMPIEEVEEILTKMEDENKSVEELTKVWIEDHRDQINEMLK